MNKKTESRWITVETTDPAAAVSDLARLYAILPNDGTHGLVVGDWESVQVLHQALGELLNIGVADERLDPDDERLGVQWMSAVEAALLYDIPMDTVRRAARKGHIKLSRKEQNVWRFPARKFVEWVENVYRPRER